MTDTAAACWATTAPLLPWPLVCNLPRNQPQPRSGPPFDEDTNAYVSNKGSGRNPLGPAGCIPQLEKFAGG